MIYLIGGLGIIAGFFVIKKLQDVIAERERMREMKERLKQFEKEGTLPEEKGYFEQQKRIRFRK